MAATLPATADLVSYLNTVGTLATQLKGTLKDQYKSFADTHNALVNYVTNNASPADLIAIVNQNLNVDATVAPAPAKP